MIYTKLYKYDSTQEENGYRGTDFSSHILIGDIATDNLTEVMGTVELTLAGLPFSKEFEPKTKFIYEKWDGEPYAETSYNITWHIIVQEDLVSKPIMSDDGYYDHHITFIEASAVAQGRLVDNISVTYKLQDVTLQGDITVDENEKAKTSFVNVVGRGGISHSQRLFYVDNGLTLKKYNIGKSLVWKFADWFPNDDPNYGEISEWTNLSYYQFIDPQIGERTISLPIPMLEIANCVENTGGFSHMGYCDVKTVVTEQNLSTGTKNTRTYYTSPSLSVEHEKWTKDWILSNWSAPEDGYIATQIDYQATAMILDSTIFPKQVAHYTQNIDNRRITIVAKPNCIYTIQSIIRNNIAYYSYGEAKSKVLWWTINNPIQQKITTNSQPVATLQFRTFLRTDNTKTVFKSAPEENAYELFQKAQTNTQTTVKQSGTPIQETLKSFYLEPQSKLELQNTTIVENFYNQKNWWEILLEIGKYIHAIPKIIFGENDRFEITWQKLGITEQKEDNSTRISIFNSKSIENYISACSSYITNMVQLGGVIDEWVAPKSLSENYLVYNDVAEIITSKPIIEIVRMEAKCVNSNDYGISVGSIGNLTPINNNGYVFEENIYNILDVNALSAVNKGLSIYYTLGTNIIKGLNYRLPTVNTGDADNEYAIKRILGTVFGVSNKNNWSKIKINDFIFHIIYRTKDSARSDQTRPDLRKYLLSSKYDNIPQHNQFNNQTDIVIDSTKFGNNIYGKLIRTGNSNYTTTEWVDDLISLKKVGDLYVINGERYYVATVKNEFYGTHIISEITYSKDYNQLSEIIGIPSEPRFYEISEQSLIEREVPLNDYILLGTQNPSLNTTLSFVKSKGWEYIDRLLFKNEDEFPKYAITVFKNDQDRKYGTVLGNETFYKDVCHPISTYSIQNTLTMEWDMVDNFSAGDKVTPTTLSLEPERLVDSAYSSLQPVKYTDAYGRSDLMDFIIINNFGNELSTEQVQNLPESPVRTRFPNYKTYIGKLSTTTSPTSQQLEDFVYSQKERVAIDGDGIIVEIVVSVDGTTTKTYFLYLFVDGVWSSQQIANDSIDELSKSYILNYQDEYLFSNSDIQDLGDNLHGLGLLKDNREKISFNYNLQMITDSDRFVLSAWLWQPNKGTLKLALLSKEINKISNETISQDIIISEHDFTTNVDETTGIIEVEIGNSLANENLTDVKAIAIVSNNAVAGNVDSGARYFVIGRNIGGLKTNESPANSNWYISGYDKSIFTHQ
jgi:hypothetical protein